MADKRLPFNLAFKTALKNRTWPPDSTGEESQALEKHLQAVSLESSYVARDQSFIIPTSTLTRDLSVSVATAGGYLVGIEKPSLIDLLRPFSAVAAYGPTVLDDLTSDISLPAATVGAVVGWSAENAALTGVGDPAFALPVALTPHLVSAQVKISRKLMASTQFDFQAGVMRELYAAIGGALDQRRQSKCAQGSSGLDREQQRGRETPSGRQVDGLEQFYLARQEDRRLSGRGLELAGRDGPTDLRRVGQSRARYLARRYFGLSRPIHSLSNQRDQAYRNLLHGRRLTEAGIVRGLGRFGSAIRKDIS